MRKIILIILISTISMAQLQTLSGVLKNSPINKGFFYQGNVIEILNAGSYMYIKIQEVHPKIKADKKPTFWIATTMIDAKVGDFLRFQKTMAIKNFKSKALNRVFDNLMFASNVQYKIKK